MLAFTGGAPAPDLLVWTLTFLQMFSHLREGVGTNVGRHRRTLKFPSEPSHTSTLWPGSAAYLVLVFPGEDVSPNEVQAGQVPT